MRITRANIQNYRNTGRLCTFNYFVPIRLELWTVDVSVGIDEHKERV
jgi:hypothetical protein